MILVLDLDDTLYDESTFVRSGFRAVAAYLAERFDLDPQASFRAMMVTLGNQGRGGVFDTVLAAEGLSDPDLVSQCVRIYREHRPQIELAPGATEMLDYHAHLPLYLVTDGEPAVQAAKVEALGLSSRFRRVYLTWSFGLDHAKPSLRCFEMICKEEHTVLHDLIYVADDPSKDFVNLRRAGAATVRVMTGRHADVVAADGFDAEHRIERIADLDVASLVRGDRRGGQS